MEDQNNKSIEIEKGTENILKNWRLLQVDKGTSVSPNIFYYLVGSVDPRSPGDRRIQRSHKLLRIGTWSKDPSYLLVESAPNTYRNPGSVTNEFFLLPKDGQYRMDSGLLFMMKNDACFLDERELKYQWLSIVEEDSELKFEVRLQKELELW